LSDYLLDNAKLQHDRAGNIRSKIHDDLYHSAENGAGEKAYVFLQQNNLESRWKALQAENKTRFCIAELGFGMGLNFLLTAKLWLDCKPVNSTLHFLSIENSPLSSQDLRRSLAPLDLDADLKDSLASNYPDPVKGKHRIWLAKNLCLTLIYADVSEALDELPIKIDAWFLDGFSPRKNEEMWSDNIWPKIFASSRPGTTLSTYTTAGSVRRGLGQAGFKVTKKPGYGKKREMLTAVLSSLAPENDRLPPAPKSGDHGPVAIIGGGLAGSCCAHQLLRRGVRVSLFEENSQLMSAASGMYQLAYYPQLARAYDSYCSFSLQAYAYLGRYLNLPEFSQLRSESGQGFLRIVQEKQSQIRQLVAQFSQCRNIVQAVSADEASQIAGIQLRQGGLYFPGSGWSNPQALVQAQCQPYVKTGQLEISYETPITTIGKVAQDWVLEDDNDRQVGCFRSVIVANGIQAGNVRQLNQLPIEPVRGQTAVMLAAENMKNLRVVLAGNVGLFPELDGKQGLSATYNHGSMDTSISTEDLDWLTDQVNDFLPGHSWQATESRVGIRCVSRDRHPIVGIIPDWEELKQHYMPLSRNARAKVENFTSQQQGLYACTAFGSHGLTHIPVCADYLASQICHEPHPLTLESEQLLSPSRFMIRDIKKQLA
jgi:tRNA 5-methylaminomethyl-2-thiouridine biosynthesis bifunctional protein